VYKIAASAAQLANCDFISCLFIYRTAAASSCAVKQKLHINAYRPSWHNNIFDYKLRTN